MEFLSDIGGNAGLLAILGAGSLLFILLALWSLVWKGLALWHAARNGQFVWFVVILIVNTAGILEIIYLIWFRKDVDTRTFASLFSFGTPKGPESSVS